MRCVQSQPSSLPTPHRSHTQPSQCKPGDLILLQRLLRPPPTHRSGEATAPTDTGRGQRRTRRFADAVNRIDSFSLNLLFLTGRLVALSFVRRVHPCGAQMRGGASLSGDDAAATGHFECPFLASPHAPHQPLPPPPRSPSRSRWLTPDEQQQQELGEDGSPSVAAVGAHLAGSPSPAAALAPICIPLVSHDHAHHPGGFAAVSLPSPVELEAAPAAGWLGGPRHSALTSAVSTPQPCASNSAAPADSGSHLSPDQHACAADDSESRDDDDASSAARMAAAWTTLSRHPHLDASARAHIALLDLVMERVCERMLSLAPSDAPTSDQEAETAAATVNQALHRVGSSFCAAGERVVELCLQQALAAESAVSTAGGGVADGGRLSCTSTLAEASTHPHSGGSASSVGTASDADDDEAEGSGCSPARKKSKDESGSPKGVVHLDDQDCENMDALPIAAATAADRKRVVGPRPPARRPAAAGGRIKKAVGSGGEGEEDEYRPRRKRKSRGAKGKQSEEVSGTSDA